LCVQGKACGGQTGRGEDEADGWERHGMPLKKSCRKTGLYNATTRMRHRIRVA
jgi:hypothetical protein